MAHRWWWRVFVVPAFVASILGGCCLFGLDCEQRTAKSYGARDFIEYWSAFQVSRAGGNPYDPQALAPVQAGVTGDATSPPLMMWNPPWTVVLMFPVMTEDFCLSSLLWVAFNFFFLGSSIALVRELGGVGEGRKSFNLFLVCFSIVILAPALRAIVVGQIGVLLMWSALLLWFSLRHNRDTLAGFCVVLLTCKPHLFIPLFIVVGGIALAERKREFFYSIAVCFFLLCLGVWSTQHRLFEWWIEGIVQPLPGAPSILQWINSSPLNVLASISGLKGDLAFQRLLLLFPFLVGLGVLAWIERKSERENVDHWFPIVSGISLLVTPFAWLFDYGLMAALTLPMVFRSFDINSPARNRKIVVLLAVVVQLLATLIFVPLEREEIPYLFFVWYSPLMFAWYFVAASLLKAEERKSWRFSSLSRTP